MLFSLVSSGRFDPAKLVGIDYSTSSVALARRLAAARGMSDMRFEVCDVLAPQPVGGWSWVPDGGFDLVLDKGTFDAMSLNDETYLGEDGAEKRVCEMYPGIVAGLVRKGGWVMVTSCNWTEEEVLRWFTEGTGGELEVWGKVEYPKFRFGGVEGQGVASVCLRRKDGSEAVDLR
jgi:EEF1A lysine methyltransferase 2